MIVIILFFILKYFVSQVWYLHFCFRSMILILKIVNQSQSLNQIHLKVYHQMNRKMYQILESIEIPYQGILYHLSQTMDLRIKSFKKLKLQSRFVNLILFRNIFLFYIILGLIQRTFWLLFISSIFYSKC